jgi:hypothetical protein
MDEEGVEGVGRATAFFGRDVGVLNAGRVVWRSAMVRTEHVNNMQKKLFPSNQHQYNNDTMQEKECQIWKKHTRFESIKEKAESGTIL